MERLVIDAKELDRLQCGLEAAGKILRLRSPTKAAMKKLATALRGLSCAMEEDDACKSFGGGARISVEWFEVADAITNR